MNDKQCLRRVKHMLKPLTGKLVIGYPKQVATNAVSLINRTLRNGNHSK